MKNIILEIILVLLLVLFCFNSFSLLDSSTLGKTQSQIFQEKINTNQKNNLRAELIYWQGQLQSKNGFATGWATLSLINWKLGLLENSKVAVNKALSLDPNNESFGKLKEVVYSKK